MADLNLKPLYENKFFQIGLDKEYSLLELSFLQSPDTEHFRNAYNLAFDAALNKEVKYWLTDATKIQVMQRENQVWLMQKMAPLFKSFQLSRFAIVMDPACFVMTNPNQVYEKQNTAPETPSSGLIKVHFDKAAACNWLYSDNEITNRYK